jgi:uncharacterized membrane protein
MKKNSYKSSNPRQTEMPDIFAGMDKKKRPACVTILKPQAEVMVMLGDFSRYPRFMRNLLRVEKTGRNTHRWTIREKGQETSWETEKLPSETESQIAWRTRGEDVLQQVSAFTVEPAVGGRGTTVSYKVAFVTGVGKLLGTAEKLQGEDPDTQAAIDLRRLKALLETGEIPTVEGQPSGREEAQAA